jgi:predicted helicase
MRESLMNSFNEIYLLDLHGNSLKKEKCPDGSKDENVFDIRQGTVIALFIKTKNINNISKKVLHSELWGMRKEKYNWLINNDIITTKWQEIAPKSEFYLFVPRDEKLLELYEGSPKITDIFPVNSVGIVTARDKLTIQFTPEKVWTTILNFSRLDNELARMSYNLGKDVRDWKVEFAQKDLINSGLDKNKIIPILYRPFDIRYTYYTGKSRGFHCMPRPNVMRHMLFGENLALITSRMTKGETFKHAQVSRNIVEVICMSPKTSNNGFVFPLYLYPDPDKKDLFSHLKESKERKVNISEKIFSALSETYKTKPNPEDIFYYITLFSTLILFAQNTLNFLKQTFRESLLQKANVFLKN